MESNRARRLASLDLMEVASEASEVDASSYTGRAYEIEFLRRQTLFQQQAADAAERAASHTQRNADYMLWSVVVLALASLANVVIALLK